jgi:hypothetical protein
MLHRWLTVITLVSGAALANAAPAPKDDPVLLLDLKSYANGKLNENLHGNNYPNNNLASLPAGRKKFGEVEFLIGETYLQLGSNLVEKKPEKIEGIKVGREFKKVHFLHACGYRAENDKVVGKYVVRYADDTKAEIEIVYGKDVVDWWAYPDKPGPTRGVTAWEGENEASKGFEAKIKLYRLTWDNPNPKKAIKAIDFVNTAPETGCAPFCVAITGDNR